MQIAETAVHAWAEQRGAGMPITAPPGPAVPIADSRFARIAAHNDHLSVHLGDLVGLLLQAAYAADSMGHSVLIPLWAEEGMHRAYAMLRLLDRRAARERGQARTGFTAGVECALARSLVSAYRALATTNEAAIVPCSAMLRDVVLNLGALFSGGNGIVVRTVIERLSLPAYKRRALVLSTSELVMNALTHAFGDTAPAGRIDVSLRPLDDRHACLRVADNGAGFRSRRPDTAGCIASGLAGLLEGDLVYHRTADWTTIAEIVFPADIAPRRQTARMIPVRSLPDLHTAIQ